MALLVSKIIEFVLANVHVVYNYNFIYSQHSVLIGGVKSGIQDTAMTTVLK